DHYLHTAHTAAMLLRPQRDPITLDPPQPGTASEHITDHDQAIAWFTTEHSVLTGADIGAATHRRAGAARPDGVVHQRDRPGQPRGGVHPHRAAVGEPDDLPNAAVLARTRPRRHHDHILGGHHRRTPAGQRGSAQDRPILADRRAPA